VKRGDQALSRGFVLGVAVAEASSVAKYGRIERWDWPTSAS
jgi:hypothetical protein